MMSAEIFNNRRIAKGVNLYSSLIPDDVIGQVKDLENNKEIERINAEAQRDYYKTVEGAQQDFYSDQADQEIALKNSRQKAGKLATFGLLGRSVAEFIGKDPLEPPKPIKREFADMSGVTEANNKALEGLRNQVEELSKLTNTVKAGTAEAPDSSGSSTNTDSTTVGNIDSSNFTGGFKGAYDAAIAGGFKPENARIMAAIAGGESTYDPKARNPDASTGDNSYGLWQINMLGPLGPERRKQFGIENNDQLLDVRTNAKAAKQIFDREGFGAWSVYRSGKYKDFLQ